MKTVNRAIILGALGNDPEVRYTKAGTPVATFSVATNSRKKSQSGEYTDVTQWHNCVTFGKLAEIVSQYVVKGTKLYVDGAIEYQTVEKDGSTTKFTKIVVSELSMLSSKNDSGKESKFPEPPQNDLHSPLDDDSIPF